MARLDGCIQFQLVEAAPRRVRARGEVLAHRAARCRDFRLTVANDPGDPEHEDLVEWIGDRFDPEAFSVRGVNRALRFLDRFRIENP